MILWLPFLLACHRVDPPAVLLFPEAPDTTMDLAAVVSDESLTLTYLYTWYQDDAPRDDLSTDTVPSAETARGETWRVEVVADDGRRQSDPGEASVSIGNAPPDVVVLITPDVPGTLDDLLADAHEIDPDGDPVTLTWSWTVDGADAGLSDATVTADRTERGQVWEATCEATDGQVVSTGTGSVLIGDILPVVTALTLTPEEAWETTLFTASAEATDGDGDPISFSWAWYVNDTLVKEGDDPTLSGDDFDKHDTVHVEATPNDGFESGVAVASDAVTVLNTIPEVDEAAFDPDPFSVDDVIACTGVLWTDPDDDTEGYAWGWNVNGSTVGADATLDLAPYSRGDTVSCNLTPFDGEESGTTTFVSATIGNAPPTITALLLSSMSPAVGDVLSVDITSSDSDGDAITYTYQWYVNGAMDVTTPTLDCGRLTSGDRIWVVVTPSDGTDMGPSAGSDTARVA